MRNQSLKQAGFVILGMVAIIGLGFTLYAVYLAYSPLPFWDQWERVTAGQHWSRILEQHNEHRIVIPTLAFMVDAALFSGRNVFSIVFIHLIQLAHVVVLIEVARRAGVRGADLTVVGALFMALLFAGAQIENFYWGFQVQFVIVYFLATVCFALAVLGRPALRFDLAAALAGAAAAFSFSAGLMVLPAAAVAVLLSRGHLRRVLILAGTALVCILLYMNGLNSTGGHSDPIESLSHPVSLLYYMLAYVGAPFGYALANSAIGAAVPPLADPVYSAQLFGVGGLIAAAAGLVITLIRRGPKARYVLLMVCGLTTMAAVLTALGRWELGVQQAFASRYGTPVLLFWSCLGAWAWSLTRNLPWPLWRQGAQLVLMVSFIIAALLLLSSRDSWIDLARAQNDRLAPAESAVLVGAPDEPALAGAYPWPDRVMEQRLALQEAGLSVFASEPARWIGESLDAVARVAGEGVCLGAFDARVPVGEDARFARASGWAWDVGRGRAPERYLAVGPAGRIVGIGQLTTDRPDVVAAIPDIDVERTGWMVHAEAGVDEQLTIYAVLGAGAERLVCRIGQR